FTAGRLVIAALSVLLGLLVWRVARGLYGRGAGILALALYALCPEALAHGGLVTLDLATALGFFAALAALVRFARSRAWRDWALLALACAATFLTRFTAWLLLGVIAAVATVATGRRLAASPRPLALWAALLVSGVVALSRRGASSRARGGLERRGPPAGAGPWAAPDAERRLAAAAFLALPLALFASSMFLVQLNVGVRYLLPSL